MQIAAADPFVHQELIEILYHTLWETVHVFFEHRELGHDVGAAGFLYPFLGAREAGHRATLVADVAASIRRRRRTTQRCATQVARERGERDRRRDRRAIDERLRRGGKLILFGNGGSATDANDWAIDCVAPPARLSADPGDLAVASSRPPSPRSPTTSAATSIFLRQLIAHARPEDVAVAISTSGGSRTSIAALEEARKRGLLTVALLGYDGGEILRRGLADHCIVVRSDYIPRIQEVQASIYHVMRELDGAWRPCAELELYGTGDVSVHPRAARVAASGSAGRSSSTTSRRTPPRAARLPR